MIRLKLNSFVSFNPAKSVIVRSFFWLVFISCFFSCKSKTDLLSLKFDQKVSKLIKDDKQLITGRDIFFGLKGYVDDEPDSYSIGDIKLSSYSYPNSGVDNHNKLLIYINGEVDYLGFKYSSVNQEESHRIIEDFKSKYPKFKRVKDRGDGESLIWDIPEMQAWIIIYQRKKVSNDNVKFLESDFVVIKKGTRIANSDDSGNINIYDYYSEMMDPALLK